MRITHIKLSSSRLVEGYGIVKYFQLGEKGVTGLEIDTANGLVIVRGEKNGAPLATVAFPVIGCDWIKVVEDAPAVPKPAPKAKQQAA